MENNSEKQIRLRKSQNTLVVVGTGIIIMSLWSVIKIISEVFINKDEIVSALRNEGNADLNYLSDSTIVVLFAVMIVLMSSIFIAARVFIGRSAIAEGNGRRANFLYIPFTVIYIVLTVMQIRESANSLVSGKSEELLVIEEPPVAALMIELTSLIMLTELLIAAIKVRQYRRNERKEGADAA